MEGFPAAALFSARVHVSDSSRFSTFELLNGVKPQLPQDWWRMIAADLVLPGADELRMCIEALNKTRVTVVRALKNKEAFDDKAKFSRYLTPLVAGKSVKLRNEKHAKGSPRFFGTFEIAKVLDNNVYILVDHDGVEYPRTVNGNSIRPVALCSLIVNNMWAAPPTKVKACRSKSNKYTTS